MLERNLIIPDLPSEYVLDTDAFDSIYINQRYIIDAISQWKQTKVTLFLYDNDETKQLLNITSELFWEDSLENIDIIWIDEWFYKMWEAWILQNYDWNEYKKSHWNNLNSKSLFVSFWIKRKIVSLLKSQNINIKSYKVTNELSLLNQWLNLKISSTLAWEDMIEKVEVLGWKSFLHPDLNWNYSTPMINNNLSQNIPLWNLVLESDGISWLQKAIENQLNNWIKRFLIKPVNASSWEWIIFLDENNYKDFILKYDFSFWDIVIEQAIDIMDLDEKILKLWNFNKELSISIQFENWEILWNPSIQLVNWSEFCGTLNIPNYHSTNFWLGEDTIRQIIDYTKLFLKTTWYTHNWWLDFLVDKSWKFYLVDPNLWRDTWAFPSKKFQKINSNSTNSFTLFRKFEAQNVFDLKELWNNIENKFDLNETKIMPVSFIKWQHLTFIIQTQNFDELEFISKSLNNLLTNNIFWEKISRERQINTPSWKINYNNLWKY